MTTPRRSTILIAIAAGVGAIALLAIGALAYTLLRPNDHTVQGTITLDRGDFTWSSGRGCWGVEGYDDIRSGATVAVLDAAGTTVAMGRIDQAEPDMDTPSTAKACVFHFKVEGVPAGAKFYSVKVTHRNGPQYTEDQLAQELQLTF